MGVELFEVGVMFAAVALMGVIANRTGQSVIPFYILIGMVLSPFVAGAIGLDLLAIEEASDFIHLGAELGIVLLLFYLGLEFNLDRLIERKNLITRVGLLDLAINFPLGFIIGYVFFTDLLAAFIVAGIIYISSSAIITKSLLDLGWIANDEANPMLGTLVFEDLFIAIYLAVLAAIVMGGEGLGEAAQSIGIALGFILVLLLLVYFGTAMFQLALETDSNEYFLLRALGILVLIAGAALAVGVSEAVAAFFVGMAFSATDFVHELETTLEPVRDTFAAIFFFWVGLVTDPALIATVSVVLLLVVGVIFSAPSKFISGFYSGRIYGLSDRQSVRVACGMVTRGEFSLIIATIALGGAGITLTEGTAETINAFAVGYVLVMSIFGSTLMQYSGFFERRVG